jgi:hypothetical protein
MRYGSVNCETYCKNAEYNEEDSCIIAAKEMQEIEDNISKNRTARFGFCSITLVNNKPAIVICDKIGFEDSIKTEDMESKKLSGYISKFNLANPLFDEIIKEFPRLKSPNKTGLQIVKKELKTERFKIEARLKDSLTFKLNNESKGRPVDVVLQDPEYLTAKANTEDRIKIIDSKIAKCNEYLDIINSIFAEGV